MNAGKDFQAYVDLLGDVGIDITDVPRTPEPGVANRWLYVWTDKPLAERFARELSVRLRDPSWFVDEFDLSDDHVPVESRGPLAPLTIVSIPTNGGTEFRLASRSQERIFRHFPNVRMEGDFKLPADARRNCEGQHDPIWDQIITFLAGIPDEAIDRIGGIWIVDEDGRVLHERLPPPAR